MPDDFGLYIHVPFCASKCPYCDFDSGTHALELAGRFTAAVERELAARAAAAPAAAVQSLFLGGGTPSRLPAWALERLIAAVRRHFRLAGDAEITAEVNPESLTRQLAAALRAAGVNRLSVGVQSLDDAVLGTLGRPHDARRALAAAALARATFPRVSFDLIIGVPGMTAAGLAPTLERLLALAPDHLAAYWLSVEEGTPFAAARARGALLELDDASGWAQDTLVERRLAAAGLERYEVSNYARPGAECRHNLAIWRGGWYLGLGPSAHSYLPAVGHPWGRREANVRGLTAYLERLASPGAGAAAGAGGAVAARDDLDRRQWVEERLLLGLRLGEGIDLERLAAAAAAPPPLVEPPVLARLVRGGYLARARHRLHTTAAGRRVLDALVFELASALRLPAGRPAGGAAGRPAGGAAGRVDAPAALH